MKFNRFLLLPFALFYRIIVIFRNVAFDLKIIPSYKIQNKSICVGNLTVGGTGKTPMTMYLTDILKKEFKIAIISRGYKRKSKGFLKITNKSSVLQSGDEPMIYHNNFKETVDVYVSEKRKKAVDFVEKSNNQTIIILDDALQHRYIQAGLNILMTNYSSPFYNDFILPSGRLREPKSGAQRSQIIVINNCPSNISNQEKNEVRKKLAKYNSTIFFARYSYRNPIPFGKASTFKNNVLFISGIANHHLFTQSIEISGDRDSIIFQDHHTYTKTDIELIHEKFDNFADEWSILTTEKDFVKLIEGEKDWKIDCYPWFYLPIRLKIDEEEKFNNLIKSYVRNI